MMYSMLVTATMSSLMYVVEYCSRKITDLVASNCQTYVLGSIVNTLLPLWFVAYMYSGMSSFMPFS